MNHVKQNLRYRVSLAAESNTLSTHPTLHSATENTNTTETVIYGGNKHQVSP